MCNKLQTRRQIWIANPRRTEGEDTINGEKQWKWSAQHRHVEYKFRSRQFFCFFCHCPHHWLQPTVFCALTLSLLWIYSGFFFHEKIGFISGLCHGFKMLSVSQKFCFRTVFLFQLPSIYIILPLLIWIEVKKETCFLGLNSKTISTSQKSGYCDKSSKFDYSSKISVINWASKKVINLNKL